MQAAFDGQRQSLIAGPVVPPTLPAFANIVFMGDSVTSGRVAIDAGSPGFVDLVRKATQRVRGATRGEGVVLAWKTRYTYVGTWTNSATYGPFAGVVGTDATGGARKSSVAASTASVVLNGDSFDIYYVTDATTAAFTVTIDSDTPVSVGGVSGSAVFAKATVAPVSGLSGQHTVKITSPASGAVIFWGIAPRAFTGGAQIHNVSLSGTNSANGTTGTVASWLPSMVPDLSVFAFEINDYLGSVSIVTFTANVTTLINAAKLTGAFALIATNAQITVLTPAQSLYVAALSSLATSLGGAFYTDIFNRWGGTNAAGVALGFISGDNIHPTLAGHVDMAIAVDAAMAVAEPPARPRYGVTNVPDAEYDFAMAPDLAQGVGGKIGNLPDANTVLLPLQITGSSGTAATYQTSVFSGGAGRFDGAGSINQNVWAKLRNVTKYTLFMVYRTSNIVQAIQGVGSDTNSGFGLQLTPTGIQALVTTTGIFGQIPYFADTYAHVIAIQYDGTQTGNALRLRVWLDGNLLPMTYSGTIPATTSNASDPSLILGQIGTNFFTGDLAEAPLVYAGANALSDANLATVMAALNTRYGITAYSNYQVVDYFTRADSALTLGTPSDKGIAWTAQSGTWGITSNTGYSVTGANGNTVTTALTTPASSMVGTFVTDAISTHVHGFLPRWVDVNNRLIVGFFGGSWSITTVVAGAVNTRASGVISNGVPTSGAASFYATVTVVSNLVTVTVNGVSMGSYTLVAGEITAFGANTNAGIFLSWTSGTATAATFDNVRIA